MDILEREIEEKFKVSMEGLGCLVFKFVSPGRAGVPDRLVAVPGGKCIFVELKRPGGKLRPLQRYWKKAIESIGGTYYVVDSYKAIANLCQEIREVMPDEFHTA